jgi:hypothetical protein
MDSILIVTIINLLWGPAALPPMEWDGTDGGIIIGNGTELNGIIIMNGRELEGRSPATTGIALQGVSAANGRLVR